MPSVEARIKYERVACPKCATAFKVPASEKDAFLATLPDACETCHPPAGVSVGPIPIANDQQTEQIGQLQQRVTALENIVLSLRQDVTRLIDTLIKEAEADVTKTRPAPAPKATATP